jgi:hypothetical protein
VGEGNRVRGNKGDEAERRGNLPGSIYPMIEILTVAEFTLSIANVLHQNDSRKRRIK